MIEKLSAQLIAWQIEKGYLDSEEKELYEYAYELLLAQILNAILACLVGALFHSFLIVLTFWICYQPLRTYSGGYHADTNGVCMAISVINLCLVCLAVKNITPQWILLIDIGCAVLCGMILFAAAPVEDQNKPLDDEERIRYGRRGRMIWLSETVIWIACLVLGFASVSLTIALSHLTLAIMLVAGILKNYHLKNTLGEQE